MIGIYISPQQGTGTWEDPFRNILNDIIDVQANDLFGEIVNKARMESICRVVASQQTHGAIAADGRATLISPTLVATDADFKAMIDMQFSSFPSAWRNSTRTALENHGINVKWVTSSNTLRDVYRYLMRKLFLSQLNNQFPEFLDLMRENLDVTVNNIPNRIKSKVSIWMTNRGLLTDWITPQTTVRQILHHIVVNLGFGKISFGKEEY